MFYVYQDGYNDCGFTSLKNYLATINHDSAYLYLPNPKQEDEMYSFKDLSEYAKTLGFELSAYVSQDKEKLSKDDTLPMLALINEGDRSHLVMVYDVSEQVVSYIDPAEGKKKVDRDYFLSIWDGKMLIVEDFKKKKCPIRKENLLTRKEETLINVMQFSACILLLLGFYFIDNKYPFYLSIIFFACFAIMEIALRSYGIALLKIIDKRVYTDSLKVKEGKMKEFYLTLEKNKSYEISFAMNSIYYIMSIVMIGFVLYINGGFNLYYLLFGLFFALIEAFFLRPYLEKKENELAILEKQINDQDISLIRRIHDSGYRYGKIVLTYRYMMLGISLLGIVLVMALSSVVSVPYVIFYLSINIFFYHNLVNFLGLDKGMRKHRQNVIHQINLTNHK